MEYLNYAQSVFSTIWAVKEAHKLYRGTAGESGESGGQDESEMPSIEWGEKQLAKTNL